MYADFECEVFNEEFETQKPLLECTKLLHMNENSDETYIPKYKELINGTSRLFKAKMNNRKQFMINRKKKKNCFFL